jgi:hypothetical protein
MTRTRILPVLALSAATAALAACAAHPNYENVAGDEAGDIALTGTAARYQGTVGPYQGTAGPYQGTAGGMAAANNQDAVINANVINAVRVLPGAANSNLQVGTLHGVVSLRGTVDSRATAQSVVQTAQQVPGVRSVDYDLEIR